MTKKEQIFNRIADSAMPISRAELAKSLNITIKTIGEAVRNLEKEGKIKSIDEGDGVPRYVEHVEVKSVGDWMEAYEKGYADAERELKEFAIKAGRREAIEQIIEKLGFDLSEVM